MRITPSRLSVLLAVHRAGGIVAAADAQHLTPSAVSQQIKLLEREAGVLALVIYDREAFFAYERELRAASEQAPDSPKSRRARLFGLIASSTSPVTMERLAQRLYMSRSTLAADLTALRDDIAPWGLSILGRENSGLVLDGNEIDIRSYIIDKAYDAIYGNRPLDGQIQDIIAKNQQYFLDSGSQKSFGFQAMLDMKIEQLIKAIDRGDAGLYVSYVWKASS